MHWLRFIALFTLFKVIKWSESFMATLKNEIIFGSKSKPFWIPHLMFCFISEKFYWRKQSETPIRTNCQNTIQTWSQVFYCILFKRVFLAKIPLCHKTRPSNNRLVFKIEFFYWQILWRPALLFQQTRNVWPDLQAMIDR